MKPTAWVLSFALLVSGCERPPTTAASTPSAIPSTTSAPVASGPPPDATTSSTSKVRRKDAPAGHGMLLFGESRVYASHLPMFHAPHDYQVLLELSLSNDPRKDRAAMHTFDPEPFELAQAETPGFEMKIEIYAGHFERGGKPIGKVTARVERVLLFEPLVADTPRPPKPRFLVMGSPEEAYAVHLITTKPDFDQVVKITAPKPFQPLATIETLDGVHVERELYLERGDLE